MSGRIFTKVPKQRSTIPARHTKDPAPKRSPWVREPYSRPEYNPGVQRAGGGGGAAFDFTKIPLYPPNRADIEARIPAGNANGQYRQKADSFTSYKPEEDRLGPVSQGSGSPGPVAPAPSVAPATVAATPCTVSTRTLVSAPDGTPATRRTVGVNEQVEMTASVSAAWSATSGTLSPTRGTTVTWTASASGGNSTVTAAPATGSPCSVTMTVRSPGRRSLVKRTDRSYTAGKAGSGFVADVTVIPTNVSFSRVQVREEAVNSVASGYYDTVLGWNGISHPRGTWLSLNTSNGGLIDTVGTNPPGTSGPFSAGTFLWAIPQSYRVAGSSGGGTVYSSGNHRQVMSGASGAETTSKEGASRSRTP